MKRVDLENKEKEKGKIGGGCDVKTKPFVKGPCPNRLKSITKSSKDKARQ